MWPESNVFDEDYRETVCFVPDGSEDPLGEKQHLFRGSATAEGLGRVYSAPEPGEQQISSVLWVAERSQWLGLYEDTTTGRSCA